ncbi:hypothetical protein [Porphyromonas gulae]|nr:hypothetical protein [Porphyromonas gulae]
MNRLFSVVWGGLDGEHLSSSFSWYYLRVAFMCYPIHYSACVLEVIV